MIINKAFEDENALYSITLVAPHCGANSLSDDLRPDETSATGGRRFFALLFFRR
jgi:hypothetical protein